MNKPEHTPTPWEMGVRDHDGSVFVCEPQIGGGVIADVYGPKVQAKANAEFIVRACNSYDANQETIRDLLAALETMLETHAPGLDDGGRVLMLPGWLDARAQAIQAIQRAKGEA